MSLTASLLQRSSSEPIERITPSAVGGLAFVTAVVTGFGVIVIGNDLGFAAANPELARSNVWGPLLVFLCLPIATIVAASAVATVTGSRRPASALATAAVVFGTLVGALSGRIVWRAIEQHTFGEIRGVLDGVAVLVLCASVLAGGVAGSLLGDRFGATSQGKRISQWSNIVATALLTYPTLELVAGRPEIGEQQLWMLGAMLLALGIAPRIGLITAEEDDLDRSPLDVHAEHDQSASVRLLVGFAAGWMTSILVNMSGTTFDGQLFRYAIAWFLPLVLAAPGVLAQLDKLGAVDDFGPAPVETFNRP